MAIAQNEKILASDMKSWYTRLNAVITSYGGGMSGAGAGPTAGNKIVVKDYNDLVAKLVAMKNDAYLGYDTANYVTGYNTNAVAGNKITASGVKPVGDTITNLEKIKCRNDATYSYTYKTNEKNSCGTNTCGNNTCGKNSCGTEDNVVLWCGCTIGTNSNGAMTNEKNSHENNSNVNETSGKKTNCNKTSNSNSSCGCKDGPCSYGDNSCGKKSFGQKNNGDKSNVNHQQGNAQGTNQKGYNSSGSKSNTDKGNTPCSSGTCSQTDKNNVQNGHTTTKAIYCTQATIPT